MTSRPPLAEGVATPRPSTHSVGLITLDQPRLSEGAQPYPIQLCRDAVPTPPITGIGGKRLEITQAQRETGSLAEVP